jgi:dTDP-4-amino-4,6-dideoxygalactose transaminase
MQFRDLKIQYDNIKSEVDSNIQFVIEQANFIEGSQVGDLETKLSEYVGIRNCITCANGTDALQLALHTWNVGIGDAVFVPDFTFFSSAEVVSAVGATPIFVDVYEDTFNICCSSLEYMIDKVLAEGKLKPKVIVAVDLFGQPADFVKIRKIADQYHLYILEDGAQGFGGEMEGKKACSFGDISTTSFFPAKPLGCYGDGGAIFTDNDEWASLIRSLKNHGKGSSKYDNVRIGMNSRLDTIQAAILLAKLPVFIEKELQYVQSIAEMYHEKLSNTVRVPVVKEGFFSSWAQYTIQLASKEIRDGLQLELSNNDIPSMIYYQKPMHRQEAFGSLDYNDKDYRITNQLCDTVLSLPFHPYLEERKVEILTNIIRKYVGSC